MVTIEEVYDTDIWIESDMAGGKHVMTQHDAEGEKPFCYCSFKHNYAYTSNSTILKEALDMALKLGAKEPVRQEIMPFERDPVAIALKGKPVISAGPITYSPWTEEKEQELKEALETVRQLRENHPN